MAKNLDQALKSHFSQKHDVPEETKLVLREKLYNSLQKPEKMQFMWLLALCMVLTTFAIFFAVEMFFGLSAALVIGVVYYLVAVAGGMAVLIFTMLTKTAKARQSDLR